MQFQTATLDNGLQIIAECNDEAHSSALGFFVETGARDETAEVSGVSHFLEHMVFKGTPNRSADEVNRDFDEMGAHYNAFTSEESTVYYAAILPEFQDRTVELLGDIMRPALREDDFNTEKQVIIEEIKMYEDQPPFGADDRCRAAFFGRHPLGHSVLGTPASVAALSVSAMRDYLARRYSPRNMVLAGAGHIDFDALLAAARRVCGPWQSLSAPRDLQTAQPQSEFLLQLKETATQQYVLQMAAAPVATSPERFAAKLMTTILGDDTGSRLFWELVDPGLVEHASLHYYDYHNAGIFMSYISCEPDRTAENLQRMTDVFVRAEREGVTEAELSQAKSKLNSRVVLGSERPRGRLFSVGANWTHRREYRTVKNDLEAVDGVTVEQIAAVLARYPLTRNTTIAVGPLTSLSAPNYN